jgi:hypothetical protein
MPRALIRAGVVLSLVLIACGPPHQRDPLHPRGPTLKVVDAKHPPVTLIAIDRSTCLVTRDRYREVRIGDAIYCHWSDGRPTAWPGGADILDAPRHGDSTDPRRATRDRTGAGGATQPARPPDG